MPGRVCCLVAAGDERAQAVAACVRRLNGVGADVGVPTIEAVRPGLTKLAAAGRLYLAQADDKVTLRYAASPEAKEALFGSDASAAWPSRVQKQMKQSTQHIPGAIFHFPLEDGAGRVDAFITDWSPFPAACAIAVHPQHLLAVPLNGQPAAWSGRYARHPLTGDLLAIWTASWVRPEFGTGAVIVNPAHSAADLEFARSVGLPVRFALAPQAPAADPATWPEPPVIKSGIAVRSGVADGQDYLTARQTYLEVLTTGKFATEYTDHVIATISLASMSAPPAPGKCEYVASLLSASSTAPEAQVAWLLESEVAPGSVIVASTTLSAELVAIRAMHIDLYGSDLTDSRVMLVGGTAAMPDGGTPAERALALLAIGPLDQTATIKAPNLEQARRFFDVHESMSGPVADADLMARPAKRSATVFGLIQRGQFDRGFAELYKIQRDIRKNPDVVSTSDRYAYFALSYLLAGAPAPAGYPTAQVVSHLSTDPG